MRNKKQLLNLFEEWVDNLVSECIGEYESWEYFLEDNDLDEEEWDELREFCLQDLFDNYKDKLTGE